MKNMKAVSRAKNYSTQIKTWIAAGLAIVLLAGCGSLKPRDFAGAKSTFEPDRYFAGHVRSWGVFENRRGEPRSRFTTDSTGSHDASGDTLITQTFTHEDGSRQQRFWHVHRLDAHRYEATANDVVGKARGEAYGNAFRWEYVIALKPGNPFSHVHLKQWMYQPDGTQSLYTRVVVTKFGVRLGEVSESFQRVDAGP